MSFPKSRAELKGLLLLAKALRLARPLLNVVGVKLEQALLDDTVRIGEQLLNIAEEFNGLFASRGWIACGAINTEAAVSAIQAAKEQRWEVADEILAEAYSADIVGLHVRELGGLRCFRDRQALALLAVDDYEAGRFHACVPVVLALLDGMGQELTGANFFRNTRKIKATESFLEIGPGVAELLRTLSRSRNATTRSPITIPFRHGILHGTDLGYNNRIVAAKAWAALLAVGHYATDYLEGPAEPPPTLMETLRRSAETRRRLDEFEAAMQRWTPRTSGELAATVATGDFRAETPEAMVAGVLDAWRSGKAGIVARFSSDSLKTDVNLLAGRIRKNLGPAPSTARIVAIVDEASAASSVTARLLWGDETDEVTFRAIHYKDQKVAPRTQGGGRWLLASLWPLECARSVVLEPDASQWDDKPL